jgi:hypothetical protein
MTVVEKSLFTVVMLLTNGGILTEILPFKTPIIVSYIYNYFSRCYSVVI